MKFEEARRISGGINQNGVRAHNERLIMSLIQRSGALPGSDIARRTGLSAQTVSVILRRLESDGLLQRGDPVKGKVGKPSTPVEIAPDGVLSIGLKIGRRSAELAIMDIRGRIRDQLRQTYAYPMPDTVFGFLQQGLHQLIQALDPALRARVCGLGVAAPSELWNWHDLVGAPQQAFCAWQDIDMQSRIASFTDLPVVMVNDATAACRAEHVFGKGKLFCDYAYLFVATFVGGGVVLNHAVYEGHQGNAGAFGSLPGPDGHGQLIDVASIHGLEAVVQRAGQDPSQLWQQPYDWSGVSHHVETWLDDTAEHLARAALAACAVIDFEAVLIDGAMPVAIKDALVERMQRALSKADLRGLIVPRIEAGQVGGNARVIGAATGPISAQFLMDQNAGLLEARMH